MAVGGGRNVGMNKPPSRVQGGPKTDSVSNANYPGKPKPPPVAKPGSVKSSGYPGKPGPDNPKLPGNHKPGGQRKNKTMSGNYNYPGKNYVTKPKWGPGAPGFSDPRPLGAPGAPGIPDIEAYLSGDQTYQGGLSELMRALDQFRAQNEGQGNTVRSAFQTALSRMADERTNALKSLEADFASRGLLNSGLYGQSVSDYNEQYQNRIGDLTTDQNNELGALTTEEQNFMGMNEAERARLRQEAIARRAAQYNITG